MDYTRTKIALLKEDGIFTTYPAAVQKFIEHCIFKMNERDDEMKKIPAEDVVSYILKNNELPKIFEVCMAKKARLEEQVEAAIEIADTAKRCSTLES